MKLRNKLIEGTEMNILSAGIGFDVYFKNTAFNASFELPAYEKHPDDAMSNSARIHAGLCYNFKQTGFLLGKKSK
jgi:hypothetical protein